jgi:hypothetical protein
VSVPTVWGKCQRCEGDGIKRPDEGEFIITTGPLPFWPCIYCAGTGKVVGHEDMYGYFRSGSPGSWEHNLNARLKLLGGTIT